MGWAPGAAQNSARRTSAATSSARPVAAHRAGGVRGADPLVDLARRRARTHTRASTRCDAVDEQQRGRRRQRRPGVSGRHWSAGTSQSMRISALLAGSSVASTAEP